MELAVGCFFTFGFVRKEVGPRYFLIHGLGALFFSVLIFLWLGREVVEPRAQIWILVFWLFGFAFSLRPWFPLYLGASTAGFLGLTLQVFHLGPLAPLNVLLSTSFLGFSLMAMLLGHWYLTQPKLSIDELMRLTWGFIASATARSIFSIIQFIRVCGGRSENEILRFLMADTPGIFLLMRLAWGILVPLGLSYFVWKTVKMRSTQSATGILYVVDLAVLTGETVSLYLMIQYGIYS